MFVDYGGAEDPRRLLDYPTKGCGLLGAALALMVSHASPTPRGKTGKSGGFPCSSPFLIPLSLSVYPSFHPSIHHHVSLPLPGSGLGEGEPKWWLQP